MNGKGNRSNKARRWVVVQLCEITLSGCAAISSPPTSSTQPLSQSPVPPPAVIPNGTPVRIDPAHPAIVHWEYYPAESKRLNEQGSCILKLTVGTDGSVQEAALIIPTGYSRLDTACLKAFRSERFLPAMQEGKPIISTIELPINWRLGVR